MRVSGCHCTGASRPSGSPPRRAGKRRGRARRRPEACWGLGGRGRGRARLLADRPAGQDRVRPGGGDGGWRVAEGEAFEDDEAKRWIGPLEPSPERNGRSDRSRSRGRSWRLAGARRLPDRARSGSDWPGTALRPRQGGAGRRPRPRRGSRRPRPSGPRRPLAPSHCRRARARTGIRARRDLRGGARRARAGFGRPRPPAASRRGLPRAQARRASARPGPRTGPSPARAPLRVPHDLLQRPAPVRPAEPRLGWARSRSRTRPIAEREHDLWSGR